MMKMLTAIIKVCILFLIANNKHVICQDIHILKFEEGKAISESVCLAFLTLFDGCIGTTMNNEDFIIDNLQRFIISPVRTTVGFMPKFTANRKFLANLLSTSVFKKMLFKDQESIRKHLINKMRYCDKAIMDARLLRDFYDREVDQSKLKK